MMVNHPRYLRRTEAASGSVLLAVLCVVAMLSLLVVTAAGVSQQLGGMQMSRLGMMRARQLAEMGVAVAVHPLIKPGDPLLRREVSGVERYGVILSTEESRLNLNAMLTEQRLPLLAKVFGSWGMSPADAQGIAATLMDWTDPDDLKSRPDSAEKFEYERLGFPGRPLNRPFGSLDEVDLVARSGEIQAARPDWRSFFTLRGNGQLDVNMASAEVLAAATGASLENAEQLVAKRNGLDELPQTEDDMPLQSVQEALAMLGIGGQEAEELAPLLTLNGTTLRIESTGMAGDTLCGLAVVVRKDGGTPQIIEWREFPVEAAVHR